MKTLGKYLFLPAFLFLTPLAGASLYEGSWKNKTFGSTGALRIDLTIKDSRASGSFDLDGPVFGGGDPPAIPFDFPLKANGSGKIRIDGTLMGNFAGSIDEDGNFSLTITGIPGGFLTEARVTGEFDFKLEKFTADYEVDNAGGLYASGVVEAHVHKAPFVKIAKIMLFSGTTGKVWAKVTTNTAIKSVKATTTGPGNITITGDNPYLITVRNLTVETARVRVTVKNKDGLSTTKTVKFVSIPPVELTPGP